MNSTGVIILAAGRGTRFQSDRINKVMLPLAGKPILSYAVSLFEKMQLRPILVVAGFAKEGIMDYFKTRVEYVLQDKQLGTAHAVSCALSKLPTSCKQVLIVNGDDSYLYSEPLISRLIATHAREHAAITLLTIEKANPMGLGRILRNDKGVITGIVEEKDATDQERAITEVNPQCWVFDVDFLKNYVPKITKSPFTGEYYLTDMIQWAVADGKRIADVRAGTIPWRGVNTPQELSEAQSLIVH